MRISGFGEQETGAWDALHRGTDRESFDSPSHYELSTLKTMLPHRRPHPPRPTPPPPPPPDYDDGWDTGESGHSEEPAESRGHHAAPEPPPARRRRRAVPPLTEEPAPAPPVPAPPAPAPPLAEEPVPAPPAADPYSFDEYADSSGSPGADDRMVPEESAYRRHRAEEPPPSGLSRHALAEEPEDRAASDLDQFWSAAVESGGGPEPDDPAPAKPRSRVRPYARTRGRTRSDHNLALEALVSTSDSGRRYRGVRSIEHRRICDLCLDTRSVAEIAAHLHLPLGVVKVLVGDMADIGLVLLHQTELILGDRSSRDFMERVLLGLRGL